MTGAVPQLSPSVMPDLTTGHLRKQRVPSSINRLKKKLIFVG
jgi:hypothetical protein